MSVLKQSSKLDPRRTKYTVYVSWVILPVALLFPLMNNYDGTLATVITGIISIIMAANVLVYYTNWEQGQNTLPLIGGLIAISAVVYFVYLGIGHGASAMWTFVLPLLVVFMLGLLWGTVGSLLCLVASVAIMLGGTAIGGYHYTAEFTGRFAVAFSMVSALALGFEYWRVSIELQKEQVDQELSRTRDALAGMANVCSWCNSIRSDTGDWLTLEDYVAGKEEKLVSHSICPSCSEKEQRSLES